MKKKPKLNEIKRNTLLTHWGVNYTSTYAITKSGKTPKLLAEYDMSVKDYWNVGTVIWKMFLYNLYFAEYPK